MKTQFIPITKLQNNTGQLEGVPKNPRTITGEDFERLVASMREDPEMMELRECIAVPHGRGYVVIAGNQRLDAARVLNLPTVPCKLLPKNTPPEKLRAITLKDNGHFGQWDEAAIDAWGDIPFADWGLPLLVDDTEPEPPKDYTLVPYEKSHVLISFPPERMMEVQDLLEKLSLYPDIEIEQGSN